MLGANVKGAMVDRDTNFQYAKINSADFRDFDLAPVRKENLPDAVREK